MQPKDYPAPDQIDRESAARLADAMLSRPQDRGALLAKYTERTAPQEVRSRISGEKAESGIEAQGLLWREFNTIRRGYDPRTGRRMK